MTTIKPARAAAFLADVAANLRQMTAKVNRLDKSLVEEDIAGRRIEANIGLKFFEQMSRIEDALKASGSRQSLDQWLSKITGRRDELQYMRRRRQLYKEWTTYVAERRRIGQCGGCGLTFALELVRDAERRERELNDQAQTIQHPNYLAPNEIRFPFESATYRR